MITMIQTIQLIQYVKNKYYLLIQFALCLSLFNLFILSFFFKLMIDALGFFVPIFKQHTVFYYYCVFV